MTRIHLFNHAEDAWESNLAIWLEQRSHESFSGHETWFVTNTYLQGNWIRRMALSHRKTLFGIHFFDRRTLRKHLCRLFGLSDPSPGREALQILLDAAAGQSQYTAPRSLLDAIDDLGASGWLDHSGLDAASSLLRVPDGLRPAVGRLTSCVYWSPKVDSILLQRAAPRNGLSLGLFGLDAESFKDLNLLLAAAKCALQSDVWIAQPLGKEGLVFEWITTLEQKLNAGAMVCPTGCAPRPYETFLAHWQGGAERKVRPPEILVGNGWDDQVEGIVHKVASALSKQAQSILVVVPENSATGPAVVHRLVACGIAVADEIRERQLLSRPSEIQINVARYLTEDQTPECFLRILQDLLRSPNDYKDFRDAFLQSFEERQVRSLRELITERHRQRFAWLRDLESALEPWPAEADWTDFHKRWESLLLRLTAIVKRYQETFAQFAFSPVNIEPHWYENFLQGYRLSSQLFLGFVAQLLVAKSNQAHPDSYHRYAKVVVTTPAKAHGTSWDYVILADAISDGWPVVPPSNPVLSDEEKSRFRQRGFVMLTGAERCQIQEERFLQLAYHARRHLLLARYEHDEQGIEAVPNELSTFAEEFLKARITHFQQKTPRLAPNRLADDFRTVWVNRLDRAKPFDHYFLNFKMLNFPTRTWHPSELEAIIKTPGTFAFRLMFNCRREVDRAFVRSAPMTVGRVAHRLLQEAFGGRGMFQAFQRAAPWSRVEARDALRDQMQLAFQKMRVAQSAYGPDLWWETISDKAMSLASRMLENVSEYFQADLWYQSEGTLSGTYYSAGEKLELEGRTDLILSDRDGLDAAALCICDFKTSKQPQNFDAHTGDGLQFLGYRLLAKVNGARNAEMFIVKADGIKMLKIPPDEELASFIHSLARMQRLRTFGRRPDERWGASEKLPIATLPIDADILDEKFALTSL